MRFAQCLLGALEIAFQPPDVADGVIPVRLWRRRVVCAEFDRGTLELLLGLSPGTADRGDLGSVDPADPGETGERLPVAVLLGRLDPLAGAPVVGHVAAGADHPTGGHPRRHW